MLSLFSLTTLLALLSLLTATLSQSVSFTEASSDLAFSLSTTTNGSATDLHLQISAPTSAGWGGVAIGVTMKGGLFFVLYPNAADNGVTVSVRGASGNNQPTLMSGVSYSVTSSVIANGLMTADISCYGCTTWSGGSLDTSSTSAAWMWAVGPGTTVESDSQSATIQQHKNYGNFQLNMVSARAAVAAASTATSAIAASSSASVATSTVAAAATSTATVAATSTKAVATSSTGAAAASTSAANAGNSATAAGTAAGAAVTGTSYNSLLIAHAILLPLAFVLLLPLGVLFLRLSSFVPVRLHYLTQATALLCALAGFGIAIAYSYYGYGAIYNEYHQIIGIIAVVLLVGQAAGGILHHLSYKRKAASAAFTPAPELTKPSRTPLAIGHIWLGRVGIALGMINAVLGFVLAGSTAGAIAIGVVGGLIYIAVGAVVFIAGRRKARNVRSLGSGSDESIEKVSAVR